MLSAGCTAAVEQLAADLKAANVAASNELSTHYFAHTRDNLSVLDQDLGVVEKVSGEWQEGVALAFDALLKNALPLTSSNSEEVIEAVRLAVRQQTGLKERQDRCPKTISQYFYVGWIDGGWPRLSAKARIFLDHCRRAFERRLVIGVEQAGRSASAAKGRAAGAKRRNRTKSQLLRERVIFGFIQLELKGLRYCKELDRSRLGIPEPWIERGCPSTYVEAYKKGDPWRKKIQDEKHRYAKKFRSKTPAEIEKIVQGTTRGTHQ